MKKAIKAIQKQVPVHTEFRPEFAPVPSFLQDTNVVLFSNKARLAEDLWQAIESNHLEENLDHLRLSFEWVSKTGEGRFDLHSICIVMFQEYGLGTDEESGFYFSHLSCKVSMIERLESARLLVNVMTYVGQQCGYDLFRVGLLLLRDDLLPMTHRKRQIPAKRSIMANSRLRSEDLSHYPTIGQLDALWVIVCANYKAEKEPITLKFEFSASARSMAGLIDGIPAHHFQDYLRRIEVNDDWSVSGTYTLQYMHFREVRGLLESLFECESRNQCKLRRIEIEGPKVPRGSKTFWSAS